MPAWKVTPEWKGQDVHIIGGGASLKDFDFHKIPAGKIIGCNDAFQLGSHIVDICLFGDTSWWQRNKWELEKFRGRVASVSVGTTLFKLPWLLQLKREDHGLHYPPSLGWNSSTGAAAINLAIQLGADQIFLLGFDLCQVQEKTHWHNKRSKLTTETSFHRFIRGFHRVADGLSLFPGVRVFNVTNGESRLPTRFIRVPFDEYLQKGKSV